MTLGDRGRLVVPVEPRQRLGLGVGDTLIMLDTPRGVVLTTRDQLKELVRSDLQGHDLVEELLDERRRAAAVEDAT